MKISLEGYSFHGLLNEGKMNIFHYLESAKYRYKLDAVGIWNGMFPNQLSKKNRGKLNKPELAANDVSLPIEFVQSIKEALKQRNLALPSLAVDWAAPWDDDENNRLLNMKNAIAHMDAASTLGADTVRIDWGVRDEKLSTKQMDVVVRGFKELCLIAQNNGMKVGPENHYGASLNFGLLLEVAQEVNSPAYGIMMHLRNWEDKQQLEGLKKLVPYIMHTHIPQYFVEENPSKIMKILIEGGYGGYWGLEHHSAKNEYIMIEYQLGLLKKCLLELGQI